MRNQTGNKRINKSLFVSSSEVSVRVRGVTVVFVSQSVTLLGSPRGRGGGIGTKPPFQSISTTPDELGVRP